MDIKTPLYSAQKFKGIGRAQRASEMPFLDENRMRGPPSSSEAAFREPRLRQSSFNSATINWKSAVLIGGGLDGCLWKVCFGEEGPYALKVFWDVEPPDYDAYYAVQRESQNAALLQMIEKAVQQAVAKSSSILVNNNPKTKDQARPNLLAFSDERRLVAPNGSSGTAEISSIPHIVKCYGWLKLSGKVFRQMPTAHWPPTIREGKITRNMSPDNEYVAIVYEYVEKGQNDPTIVEKVDRFFWLAGFGHTLSPAARNWRNSILVDHSDIVHPYGNGWHRKLYGARSAKQILL